MDNEKRDFAIEVLQTRRKEIRTEEEFTEHRAFHENAITEAIEVLYKHG